jgi:hypothetical protein
MTPTLLPLTFLLTLAACGSGSQDGVGGVSAGEAQALNEAAAQIDAQTGAAVRSDPGLNPAAMTAASADRHLAVTQPVAP